MPNGDVTTVKKKTFRVRSYKVWNSSLVGRKKNMLEIFAQQKSHYLVQNNTLDNNTVYVFRKSNTYMM